MVHCTTYKEQRSHRRHLQQPYIESDKDILGHFLFDKRTLKKIRIAICHMVKKTTSNEDNINKIVSFNVWSIINLKFPYSCAW